MRRAVELKWQVVEVRFADGTYTQLQAPMGEVVSVSVGGDEFSPKRTCDVKHYTWQDTKGHANHLYRCGSCGASDARRFNFCPCCGREAHERE